MKMKLCVMKTRVLKNCQNALEMNESVSLVKRFFFACQSKKVMSKALKGYGAPRQTPSPLAFSNSG